MKHQNNDWEVLTPNGWKDFDGIERTLVPKNRVLEIHLEDGKSIKCSGGHQLVVKRDDEVSHLFADLVEPIHDYVLCAESTFVKVVSKTKHESPDIDDYDDMDEPVFMYDLVNVDGGYEYYANDIVNHNCAHITDMDEIWVGLSPTLSTGGKAILISTPLGVGNTFHRIWVDAIEGKNDFTPIELPWTVHPERDQEWYDRESANTRAGKGERGVQQEYHCSFNASGDTFAKTEILNIIEQGIRDPIAKHPNYPDCWIWKYAQPDHKYLIAADVSRGNSADFSTFHVFDTTSDEVVCEFKSKVYPDVLADILIDVGKRYNTALICPELNTYGAHTANDLKKKGYPNLYYEKVHKNIYMAYMDTQTMSADELPGWTSGQKSRDEAIARLEAVLRNQIIRLPSKRLLNELKTFIWKNNKAQAMKGYNDDLVMALAMGVTLYETSGRPQYSQEELAASLIAGMSVNTSKMGVSLGDWGVREQQTQSPFFAGSRGTASSSPNKFLPSQQPVAPKSGNNNAQNFADPYWSQWAWVTKD
jgi:hypothetical protein